MFRLKTYSFLLLIFLFNINAATYYVATTGNDTTGDGSIGNPYLTVQKGLTIGTAAGDIISVGPGTFNERPDSKGNGTAIAPITLIGSGTNSTILGGFNCTHDYNHVLNFQFSGYGTPTFDCIVKLRRTASYCLISSNWFYNTKTNCYQLGMSDPSPATNSLTAATNNLIYRNCFETPGYPMMTIFGANNVIAQNLFRNSTDNDAIRMFGSNQAVVSNYFINVSEIPGSGSHIDIIQTFGTDGRYEARNILFANNIASNCVGQICNLTTATNTDLIMDWTFRNNLYYMVGRAGNIYVSNVAFYNNTFYHCTTNLGHPLQFKWSDTYATHGRGYNGKVYNNIFVNCGSTPTATNNGWYWQETNALNLTADYNFITGTNGQTKAVSETHGINTGDIKFVAVNANFQLTNGSPAIAVGTNLSAIFTDDLNGVTRSNLWDMGAYQYLYTAPTNSAVLRPRQPERTSWILNRLYHLIGRNRKPRKCYAKKTRNACRACR